MNPSLASAIIAVVLIAALIAGSAWWSRRVRRGNQKPQFELEKLIKCKSCGSLIPEGVRRCAFCGAWQRHPENK